MFGWELPPYNSGGLGTASLGLTKGLSPLGVDIDFVLPKVHGNHPFNHMRIHDATDHATAEEIRQALGTDPLLQAKYSQSLGYGTSISAQENGSTPTISYSNNYTDFSAEYCAAQYAYQARNLAQKHDFELIHCHDWMTYYSGMAAKEVSQKRGDFAPLITQVHATEIDRGGITTGNQAILEVEQRGLEAADRVVAVSHYTKGIIHKHYGIPKSKISVVHNGIDAPEKESTFDLAELKKHYKIVLFMGRLTMSKGPDYFLKLAKEVTSRDPKVRFVMVGSGDMEKKCIEMAAEMGLTGKILFSSFLRGSDVNRAYQLADLFVMPSVSEPFGLVALEALQNGTPAIVSKQSGVAEVSANLIQVDFWDIQKMSQAVQDVLNNPHYATTLRQGGKSDLARVSWGASASRLKEIYQEVLTTGLQARYA